MTGKKQEVIAFCGYPQNLNKWASTNAKQPHKEKEVRGMKRLM